MPNPITLPFQPRIPGVHDARGYRRARATWVIAASETEAEERARAQDQIGVGEVYIDHQGGTPDENLRGIAADVETISPAPVDGDGLFIVTVFYGYPTLIYTEQPPVVGAPPRLWIETAEEQVKADIDRSGAPIANSADEVFDPPATLLLDRETIVAEWYEESTSFIAAYGPKRVYRKKLNSSAYLGAPQRCLMCRDVLCEEISMAVTGNSNLYRFHAKLEFRPQVTLPNGSTMPGWDLSVENRGFRVKLAGNETGYKYLSEKTSDGTQVPITTPVFLNDAGTAVSSSPTYKRFIMYPEISFTGLIPGFNG